MHNANTVYVFLAERGGIQGVGGGERGPQSRRRITVGAAKRIIDASVLMASPAVYYERFSRCDANAAKPTPREKALRIYEP